MIGSPEFEHHMGIDDASDSLPDYEESVAEDHSHEVVPAQSLKQSLDLNEILLAEIKAYREDREGDRAFLKIVNDVVAMQDRAAIDNITSREALAAVRKKLDTLIELQNKNNAMLKELKREVRGNYTETRDFLAEMGGDIHAEIERLQAGVYQNTGMISNNGTYLGDLREASMHHAQDLANLRDMISRRQESTQRDYVDSSSRDGRASGYHMHPESSGLYGGHLGKRTRSGVEDQARNGRYGGDRIDEEYIQPQQKRFRRGRTPIHPFRNDF